MEEKKESRFDRMQEDKKGTKLTKFWTETIRDLKEKGEVHCAVL